MDTRLIKDILAPDKTVDYIFNGVGREVWRKPRLPYAYIEMPYLQANSADARCDTGIVARSTLKMQFKMELGSDHVNPIIGYLTGVEPDSFRVSTYNSGFWLFYDYGSGSGYNRLTSDKQFFEPHIIYELECGNRYVTDVANGTTICSASSVSTFSKSYHVFLFGNDNEGDVRGSKVFYIRIYDNNNLILEYIPCVRRSDGVIGFYDLSSNIFIVPNGSWSVPSYRKESDFQMVEYIQTTGTQKMDAPWSPVLNNGGYSRIVFDIEPTALKEKSNYFFKAGVSNSATSDDWYSCEYTDKEGCYVNVGNKTLQGMHPMNVNQRYLYEFICSNGSSQLYRDYSRVMSISYGGVSPKGKIIFFCDNGGAFSAEKVYSIKIYLQNSNNLCYDLRPCYNKSSGEIGMYDAINNIFLTNTGAGAFIKGHDI